MAKSNYRWPLEPYPGNLFARARGVLALQQTWAYLEFVLEGPSLRDM